MAVVAGVESAVRLHIDRGDDLNARDDKGQTPLMLSAARNKASICKLLLEAGADADLLDPVGHSALNIAQAAGATDAASVIEAACMPQTLQDDVFREPAVISPDAQRAQAANDEYSDDSNQQFQFKSASQSNPNLPLIPIQTRPHIPVRAQR